MELLPVDDTLSSDGEKLPDKDPKRGAIMEASNRSGDWCMWKSDTIASSQAENHFLVMLSSSKQNDPSMRSLKGVTQEARAMDSSSVLPAAVGLVMDKPLLLHI